jgi:hypothetical protein
MGGEAVMKKHFLLTLSFGVALGLFGTMAGATPLLQDPERLAIVKNEGWADLYFAGLTAAALDGNSVSSLPKSIVELEKTKYLLWAPKPGLKVTDVSKNLTRGRIYSKHDLMDFENDLLKRKHSGDLALKPGEVLIAYSDSELLFAAGIYDGDKPAMVGPKKVEIRRSPNTVDTFLYRQIKKAVEMFEAKNGKSPVAPGDLTEAAGTENKSATGKLPFASWFSKALDEVSQ